jgi:hypothetical protein
MVSKEERVVGLVVSALLAFSAPASAAFDSPTLVFGTPTADVLPAGSMAISADVTGPLTQTSYNIGWWEGNAHAGFSPFKGFGLGLTAYTVKDYVLDLEYQVLGGPGRLSLAVGVGDVGLHAYVSPVGHDTSGAWPDWKYNAYLPRYNRTTERFSAHAVTSIPLRKVARLNLGLGRGRFVAYDSRSKYLNSDIFFHEYHQWALGLFGGLEVYVHPSVALVVEASGRDWNSGVKLSIGPFRAAVAWTKMEGLIFARGAKRFGRIDIGVGYQFDRFEPPLRV